MLRDEPDLHQIFNIHQVLGAASHSDNVRNVATSQPTMVYDLYLGDKDFP
jgi:hypothetical protein